MQRKDIYHPIANRIVTDLINKIPVCKRGTYNRQDPTMFQKGEIEVDGYLLSMHDCTWGVELTIEKKGKVISDIYSTWDDHPRRKCLVPRKSFKMKHLKLMKALSAKLPEREVSRVESEAWERFRIFIGMENKLKKIERDLKSTTDAIKRASLERQQSFLNEERMKWMPSDSDYDPEPPLSYYE